MVIQMKPHGGLERKIGGNRGIKPKSVISAHLGEEPGSKLDIDVSYLLPHMEKYIRLLKISEEPNISGIKGRDFIIELEYRQTALNGQVYPMYIGIGMDIELNKPYQLPDDVNGINKKLEIRGEDLKPSHD